MYTRIFVGIVCIHYNCFYPIACSILALSIATLGVRTMIASNWNHAQGRRMSTLRQTDMLALAGNCDDAAQIYEKHKRGKNSLHHSLQVRHWSYSHTYCFFEYLLSFVPNNIISM